jgi:hypothetical protein
VSVTLDAVGVNVGVTMRLGPDYASLCSLGVVVDGIVATRRGGGANAKARAAAAAAAVNAAQCASAQQVCEHVIAALR